MKVTSKVFGMCLAMALCLPLHAGKVYKWQDENGAWHYSEKPPLHEKSEILTIKSPSPAIKTPDELKPAEDESSSKEQGSVTTKSIPKPAYTDEEKRANCELATSRLKGLETHPRVLINDETTGEQRYLSPEEHAEWVARSRKEIEKFCN